jgi:hypothetical protein
VCNVQVRPGDWFAAGGWCGSVRQLQLPNIFSKGLYGADDEDATDEVDADAGGKEDGRAKAKNNNNKKGTGKGDKKDKKKKGSNISTVNSATGAAAFENPTVATPGMAVMLLVVLHKSVSDPRPIGDTVHFHRDLSAIKQQRKLKEQQQKQIQMKSGGTSSSAQSGAQSTPDKVHLPIKPAKTNEQFITAKAAAEHAMQSNQLPLKLAHFAVPPQDAIKFGLDRLLRQFSKQKLGLKGISKANIHCIMQLSAHTSLF